MNRWLALLLSVPVFAGCGVGRRIDAPPEPTTYYQRTQDYRHVFDVTRDIIDRYGMVLFADRSQGEIEAETLPDTSMFHRTRRLIHAYVTRNPRGHDVEIRVVYQIDDSEPDSIFDDRITHYDWRIVGSDTSMETLLLQEVRLALTQNAYLDDYNWRDHPFPRIQDDGTGPAQECPPCPECPGEISAPTVQPDEATLRARAAEGLSVY